MKRLLKVTSMTALLTLFKMMTGFIIAKVVAIYTGPSGLAMLGQIQSVITSLNGLVNAPAGSGVVRFTAEYSSKGLDACSPWWKASVQWVLVILAIITPLGLIFSKELSLLLFQNEQYHWIIIISVLMLPITALGGLFTSIINGKQLYKRYVIVGMISAFISAIIMVGMIIMNDLNGALLAVAMQAGLAGLVIILSSWQQPWFRLKYFWGKTTVEHKKKIGGYVLMAITTALTMPVALIIVRKIIISTVGLNEAGHWQAVWKISEVYLGVITMALSVYYLPRLSIANGFIETKSIVWNTLYTVLPIVSLLALLVYLFRDLGILILFTEEFRAARDLFAVQLVGDIFKIASWILIYPIVANGKIAWFITIEIGFSFIFVCSTSMLVKEFGVQGANIAYCFSYLVIFMFACIFLKKII